MRVLLFLAALLLPVSAFALGDAAIEYCFTTANPKACLHAITADVQQRQVDTQREVLNAQLELARIQANGLMLFGSGPALINGMNQGFRQMQQPYVSTPYYNYSTLTPTATR